MSDDLFFKRLRQAQEMAATSATAESAADQFATAPSAAEGRDEADDVESVEARHRRIEEALRQKIGLDVPPIIVQARQVIAVLLAERPLQAPLGQYVAELRAAIDRHRGQFTAYAGAADPDVASGAALVVEGLDLLRDAVTLLEGYGGDAGRLIEADKRVVEASRCLVSARDAITHREDLLEETSSAAVNPPEEGRGGARA